MTTTIKYIGSNSKYAELPVTGKQSLWQTGQQEERPDAEANLLLATGLFSAIELPVTAQTNPATGLVELNAGGAPIAVTGGGGVAVNTLQENQYTRAFFTGRGIRSNGNVLRDHGRYANDGFYINGITDGDVLNETDVLNFPGSAGLPSGKAVQLDPESFQWDLGAGESLFMQMSIRIPAVTGGPFIVMGNSDGDGIPGMVLLFNGTEWRLNIRTGTGVGTVHLFANAVAAGVFSNLTIWIDGATKRLNFWRNRMQRPETQNATIGAVAGSFNTLPPVPQAWTFGNATPGGSGLAINFPTVSPTTALALRSFRAMVLPAGVSLANAMELDQAYNNDPYRLLADSDVVTAAN